MCIFFIQWFNDLWLLWAWTWKWIYWSSGIGPTRLLVKLIILMQMSTPFNSPLWALQWWNCYDQMMMILIRMMMIMARVLWYQCKIVVVALSTGGSWLPARSAALLTINQNYHHHYHHHYWQSNNHHHYHHPFHHQRLKVA